MSVAPPMVSSSTSSVLQTEPPTERAFRDLVRTIGLLERVMQPQFARFGISGSQWAALRALHRAEQEGHEGLRVTDLSDRLLIRPPSVTGVIDRLERIHLVVRDQPHNDLRSRCVRLTDTGRQLVTQVTGVYAGQVERALGGLHPEDQQELQRLLGRLSAHLQSLLDESNGVVPAQGATEMKP